MNTNETETETARAERAARTLQELELSRKIEEIKNRNATRAWLRANLFSV